MTNTMMSIVQIISAFLSIRTRKGKFLSLTGKAPHNSVSSKNSLPNTFLSLLAQLFQSLLFTSPL